MKDRLHVIKEKHEKDCGFGMTHEDVGWLIAEIERLRGIRAEAKAENNDKVAAKLVEISDHLGDRKDQDALDIDWLIMRVALLRRHNELLHTQVAALMEKLSDLEQRRG